MDNKGNTAPYLIKYDTERFIGINFPNGYTVLVGPAYGTAFSGIFAFPVSDYVTAFVYFGSKDESGKFIKKKCSVFTSGNKKKNMVQSEKINHILTANEFVELIEKVKSEGEKPYET